MSAIRLIRPWISGLDWLGNMKDTKRDCQIESIGTENTTIVYTSQSMQRITALYSELDKKYCKAYGEERALKDGSFYVIDLTQDNLKQNLRKSYKSLVNKKDGIIFSPTVYNLKQLHLKVAGRKTRSDETWDIQEEMIRVGEAFVIELYNDCGTLVSAALFCMNEWCCYYAVAASLPGVNSHPVIWSAIEYCKSEGLKRFDLGEKLEGTEKEKNISKFKAGFGANLEMRLTEKL